MRPHTMFIQSQVLPWESGDRLGRPETSIKLLSHDVETGAATALIRYPAGFACSPEPLACTEEILLLDGSLQFGATELNNLGYARFPESHEHDQFASAGGAVTLTMFSADPTAAPLAVTASATDPVLLSDLGSQGLAGWVENPYTRYLVGTGVQPLFEHPDTGEISILYSALPFRYMEKRWSHPEVQEMYVLAGSYVINDVGNMAPGAYAWWQSGRYHGPYGSRTGFMMFIRSVGGPLANLIEPERIPVDYDAPYKPVLPEHLQRYARPLAAARSW